MYCSRSQINSFWQAYQAGATSHEHPSEYDWVQSIDIDIEHCKHPGGTQQENKQSVREPEAPINNKMADSDA